MAISNIHETLLMYTKQKSRIQSQLSDMMMNILVASKQANDSQIKFNARQQDAYYTYYIGQDDPAAYEMFMEALDIDKEFEMSRLNSWESQLELEKNNLETRLNEITTFEQSFTKLLGNNIKSDFSYGGGQ